MNLAAITYNSDAIGSLRVWKWVDWPHPEA